MSENPQLTVRVDRFGLAGLSTNTRPTGWDGRQNYGPPTRRSGMSRPLDRVLSSQPLRDGLFVVGAIAGVLFVAGFLGYGNFAATIPGVVVLVLIALLGVRASRSRT